MYSLLRTAAFAVAMISFSVSSSGAASPEEGGFAITLNESGEVILTDEHIASYDWDKHRIALTTKGIERWQSFVKFNDSFDPPIRQLSDLTTKEFTVMLDGAEMYRGHFTSFVSSLGLSGVTLYDTLGVPGNEVWMKFSRLDGKPAEDPRSRPEIEEYFRKQGKLNVNE